MSSKKIITVEGEKWEITGKHDNVMNLRKAKSDSKFPIKIDVGFEEIVEIQEDGGFSIKRSNEKPFNISHLQLDKYREVIEKAEEARDKLK